jgi:hypothetical protein
MIRIAKGHESDIITVKRKHGIKPGTKLNELSQKELALLHKLNLCPYLENDSNAKKDNTNSD